VLTFDNQFRRELPGDPETSNTTRQVNGAVWSPVMPTPVASPRLIAYSQEMANELGLSAAMMQSTEGVNALGGNGVFAGSEPYATVYGGHQFGHWAGQLGDGRAIYLGEVVNAAGKRFLCSEAMFHLGIPTTRALSLVATGDKVVRDMFYDGNPEREPGAIVCRVAPSFTRFGHFEIHAARNDTALLKQLVEFTIARDFPDLDLPVDPIDRIGAWFAVIAERTAVMVAHWMRVGFVHGVMNTDNMSILGLTIDYGPYGWIDNFDPGWTPNTTDAEGRRYCYGRQPEIARWNLERLGSALLTLTTDESAEANRLVDLLQAGMAKFDETFDLATRQNLAGKFGFSSWREEDTPLVNEAFRLLVEAEMDMTIFFRRLAGVGIDPEANRVLLADAFYRQDLREIHQGALDLWLGRYLARTKEDDFAQSDRAALMNRFNPHYVMRNYLAQQAIDLATEGDNSMVIELLDVMRRPYEMQVGRERFAEKRPDWARQKAGCSMLSCSS